MTLTVALVGAALAWFAFARPAFLENPQHRGDRRSRRIVADVSIIVPARNEERSLPTLLASLKSGTRRRR